MVESCLWGWWFGLWFGAWQLSLTGTELERSFDRDVVTRVMRDSLLFGGTVIGQSETSLIPSCSASFVQITIYGIQSSPYFESTTPQVQQHVIVASDA
jgi:hypothetical protein